MSKILKSREDDDVLIKPISVIIMDNPRWNELSIEFIGGPSNGKTLFVQSITPTVHMMTSALMEMMAEASGCVVTRKTI